jgi:hypothetical protein
MIQQWSGCLELSHFSPERTNQYSYRPKPIAPLCASVNSSLTLLSYPSGELYLHTPWAILMDLRASSNHHLFDGTASKIVTVKTNLRDYLFEISKVL